MKRRSLASATTPRKQFICEGSFRCVNHEVAYLIGALRDASIDFRKGKNYELRLYQDCDQWLEVIAKILEKNFSLKSRVKNKLLRATGKPGLEELIRVSEYVCPQDTWGTPSQITEQSPEIVWSYVSGFWDAEGGLPLKPAIAKQKYVSFDQKAKSALEFIRNFLVSEGFIPTHLTYSGQVWQFRITRFRHMQEFARRINSMHFDKRSRLSELVASLP